MRSNVKPCIYNVFTAPTFENLVKLSISSYLNVKGCTISEGYTSVMDLYSRKIISWVLSETLEASHVVEFLGFFLGRARPFQVFSKLRS